MNIKKAGNPPPEKPAEVPVWVGTHTCRNCGCEFELTLEDQQLITGVHPDDGGPVVHMGCPSCKAFVYLYPKT